MKNVLSTPGLFVFSRDFFSQAASYGRSVAVEPVWGFRTIGEIAGKQTSQLVLRLWSLFTLRMTGSPVRLHVGYYRVIEEGQMVDKYFQGIVSDDQSVSRSAVCWVSLEQRRRQKRASYGSSGLADWLAACSLSAVLRYCVSGRRFDKLEKLETAAQLLSPSFPRSLCTPLKISLCRSVVCLRKITITIFTQWGTTSIIRLKKNKDDEEKPAYRCHLASEEVR